MGLDPRTTSDERGNDLRGNGDNRFVPQDPRLGNSAQNEFRTNAERGRGSDNRSGEEPAAPLTQVKNLFNEINWDYAVIERLEPQALKPTVIAFNLQKAVVERDPSANIELKAGDVVTVSREMRHKFHTDTGVVFEEISSTHFVDDSFYTDSAIAANTQRKTILAFWM